jgi:hypothetical protein
MHPQAEIVNGIAYFDMDPASSHTRHPEPYWNGGGYHRELCEFVKKRNMQLFQRVCLRTFSEARGIFFPNVSYLESSGLLSVARDVKTDMAGRMNVLDGVVFAMLGAAYYFGFKKIYLIGCDYTFSPQQLGHFFGDHLGYTDNPVDSRHKKMRDFLESHGVNVINLTPDGLTSPVYDSQNMKEFISQRKGV